MKENKTLSTYYQQINPQHDVYKSNRLIESSYKLTTAQNRLIYMAMTKLKRIILDKNMNLEEAQSSIKQAQFELICIDVIDYKKKFNIKSNKIYKDLELIASSLYEEEILYFNEETNDFGRMRWLTTCEYDNNQKGVKIEFNPRLIKDLLIFNGSYTRMSFSNFVDKLKSKYSFRVYELCKQYLSFGKRIFYVEDLKFKLRVLEDEYATYSNFKRRIIMTAVKEICTKTDLYLEYTEIQKNKKTKKVEKVMFIIREQKINETSDLPQQINVFSNDEVAMTLDDAGIVGQITNILNLQVLLSAKDADDIYNAALLGIEHSHRNIGVKDYLKEKKEVVESYAKTKNINFIGSLISALKGDWKIKTINKSSAFNDFDQRKYDFDDLERKLLGWDRE